MLVCGKVADGKLIGAKIIINRNVIVMKYSYTSCRAPTRARKGKLKISAKILHIWVGKTIIFKIVVRLRTGLGLEWCFVYMVTVQFPLSIQWRGDVRVEIFPKKKPCLLLLPLGPVV